MSSLFFVTISFHVPGFTTFPLTAFHFILNTRRFFYTPSIHVLFLVLEQKRELKKGYDWDKQLFSQFFKIKYPALKEFPKKHLEWQPI